MIYAALVLTFIKIFVDLLCLSISQKNKKAIQTQNIAGKKCISFQEQDQKVECTNIIYKSNLSDGKCPREACGGFSVEDIEISKNTLFSPPLQMVRNIVSFFPEIVALMLAMNEIINK